MRGVLALLLVLGGVLPAQAQSAEDEIRAAFATWTEDFNAGRTERICDLFARDLIADFRGASERGYERQCQMLHAALTDKGRRFHNALTIRDIAVSGDIAVVRVVWTQIVQDRAGGKETRTVEAGLDVLRREADGRWRIFRYMAYEE